MPKSTYGTTIFCDDFRQEVGNKVTLVGCYNGDLQFTEPFPNLLPIFVIQTSIIEAVAEATEPFSVKIMFEDEEGTETVFYDADLPVERKGSTIIPSEDTVISTTVLVKSSPYIFQSNGRVKVRGFRGSEVFKLGALQVRGPASADASSKKQEVTE